MNAKKVPAGYHTINPCLSVQGAAELIEFLKKAFNAQELERFETPQGSIAHATLQIGDSIIMLGERKDEAMPGSFYLYVDDADLVYRQALAAGAVSLLEPVDQFWGDRQGAVRDRFGNLWQIATHLEDVPTAEIQRRMADCPAH